MRSLLLHKLTFRKFNILNRLIRKKKLIFFYFERLKTIKKVKKKKIIIIKRIFNNLKKKKFLRFFISNYLKQFFFILKKFKIKKFKIKKFKRVLRKRLKFFILFKKILFFKKIIFLSSIRFRKKKIIFFIQNHLFKKKKNKGVNKLLYLFKIKKKKVLNKFLINKKFLYSINLYFLKVKNFSLLNFKYGIIKFKNNFLNKFNLLLYIGIVQIINYNISFKQYSMEIYNGFKFDFFLLFFLNLNLTSLQKKYLFNFEIFLMKFFKPVIKYFKIVVNRFTRFSSLSSYKIIKLLNKKYNNFNIYSKYKTLINLSNNFISRYSLIFYNIFIKSYKNTFIIYSWRNLKNYSILNTFKIYKLLKIKNFMSNIFKIAINNYNNFKRLPIILLKIIFNNIIGNLLKLNNYLLIIFLKRFVFQICLNLIN